MTSNKLMLVRTYTNNFFIKRKAVEKFISPSKIDEIMVFSYFPVMLSQLTIFEVPVKHRSDTFLLKPSKFCYLLLDLFSPASIAVVWFCSFIFIFSLFFSNKFLKPTFCPRKFWKVLIVAKFVIIYSNRFILCHTIMSVYRSNRTVR